MPCKIQKDVWQNGLRIQQINKTIVVRSYNALFEGKVTQYILFLKVKCNKKTHVHPNVQNTSIFEGKIIKQKYILCSLLFKNCLHLINVSLFKQYICAPQNKILYANWYISVHINLYLHYFTEISLLYISLKVAFCDDLWAPIATGNENPFNNM